MRSLRHCDLGMPERGDDATLSARATLTLRLYRRTLDRTIAAEYAAITRLWFKQGFAAGAFIEPLANVGRHDFLLFRTAYRASDHAFQYHGARGGHFFTVVG